MVFFPIPTFLSIMAVLFAIVGTPAGIRFPDHRLRSRP
jgi:hypothetical protein